jgi:hypothetical protein
MKTKTKQRNKKVKSSKVAGRKTTTRSRVASRDYPIAETLRWVADGEKLLRMWGAIKSPTAKRISGRVAKVLPLLETINEIRKI